MSAGSLTSYLLPGERIVWSGKPGQGLMFASRDVFMVPFSLLWGGFAVFWEMSVMNIPGAPLLFRLWGIPFVLIGLYMIIGRFFVDAFLRRRIDYVITNRRVLILGPGPFASLRTIALDKLPEVTLREGRNGRGSIYLGQPVQAFGRGGSSGWTPSLDQQLKLIDVDHVHKPFALLQLPTPRDTAASP